MRLTLLVALVLGCGCAKLNPAFGDENAAGTDGAGSDGGVGSDGPASGGDGSAGDASDGADGSSMSTSPGDEDGSAGEGGSESGGGDDSGGDPELVCEEPGFGLQILGDELPCDGGGAPDLNTCAVLESVGGVLTVGLASGCGTGGCMPNFDDAASIAVEGVNFEELYDAPTCVTMQAWGHETDAGTCRWDALFLWSDDGLDVALGTAIRDLGEVTETRTPDGEPFIWDTKFDEFTTCGQNTGCMQQGWRAVTVGDTMGWAYADGDPLETAILGQEMLVFNWGLNVDLSCQRHGRWAMLPPEHLTILE